MTGGCTPNADAIADALKLNAEDVDAGTGAFPWYERHLMAWAVFIDANPREQLDPPTVYIAAHCLMGLSRTAAANDGLALLRAWLSYGRPTSDLIAATIAWSKRNAESRRRALLQLGVLALELQQDVAGFEEADAVDAELAEFWDELRDLQSERMQPYLSTFAWLPATRAVKALAKAVRSFCRSYPMRTDPLASLEAVAEARAVIARKVTP